MFWFVTFNTSSVTYTENVTPLGLVPTPVRTQKTAILLDLDIHGHGCRCIAFSECLWWWRRNQRAKPIASADNLDDYHHRDFRISIPLSKLDIDSELNGRRGNMLLGAGEIDCQRSSSAHFQTQHNRNPHAVASIFLSRSIANVAGRA